MDSTLLGDIVVFMEFSMEENGVLIGWLIVLGSAGTTGAQTL